MEKSATPQAPARRRIWLFRLLAVALAFIVLLLLAEAGARIYAKATGNERAMAYHPELGWKPLPNVTKTGTNWGVTRPAKTNSRGWRDDEHAFEKPSGVRRLLLIGDSFAFGLHVDDTDRISELLERDSKGLEVVNLSVSAWGPDQALRALEIEGFRYSPDLLVFLTVTWNDLDDIRKDRNSHWPKPRFELANGELELVKPELPWDVRLRSISYVAEFVYQRTYTHDMAERWAPGWESRDPLPLYAAIVRRIANHCRERAIPHAAVIGYPQESLAAGPSDAERGMRAALEEAGFLTNDTLEVFREHVARGEPLYWENNLHWNARGHELAAQSLRGLLLECGWVR